MTYRNPYFYPLLLFSLSLTYFCYACLQRYRQPLPRSRTLSFNVGILLITISVSYIFGALVGASPRYEGLSRISDVTLAVAEVLLAFLLFYELSRKNGPSSRANLQERPSEEQLKGAVSSIFNSQDFLTTLRTALPTGREDTKYGFDHIPYMLQSIEERRHRASSGARIFLVATLVVGGILAGVVFYFGLALVNDTAAGPGRLLSQIDNSLDAVKADLYKIAPTVGDARFQQLVGPSLIQLRNAEAGQLSGPVQDAVNAVLDDPNLQKEEVFFLSKNLNQAFSGANASDKTGKEYLQIFRQTVYKINQLGRDQEQSSTRLAGDLGTLEPILKNADEDIRKPENRTPELIKRLSVGIVVSTFFLALLRYLGGLYRVRYEQVLSAERDDFMIRRFYVALKSAYGGSDERKAVLSAFMSNPTGIYQRESDMGDSKQSLELLKELLGAITKKV